MRTDTSRFSETGRPKLGPKVLWYEDGDRGFTVVVNSGIRHPQITRLARPFEVRLLACCTGEHTVSAIAEMLGAAVAEVLETLRAWETLAPGTFTWLGSSDDDPRRVRARAAAAEMYREWRALERAPTDNVHYHAHDIRDATEQFELVEITVSHAFSEPSRCLGGRTYGEAFCDRLLTMGVPRAGARILEIGCGTGRFARSVLDRLRQRRPRVYAEVRYVLFDLAPTLQASQQELCASHAERTEFRLGNIEAQAFEAASFDLIIANEMIADLSVASVEAERAAGGRPPTDAECLATRYALAPPKDRSRFLINQGAIRLLERAAEWLAPGGTVIVTEYGSPDSFPALVELHGHNEHSIHFGHLGQVAETLGLRTTLEDLGTFFGFDGAQEVIHAASAPLLIHHLLPFLGRERLPLLAYDRDALRARLGAEMDRIGNLRFSPLKDDGLMNPFKFHALVCGRPLGPS